MRVRSDWIGSFSSRRSNPEKTGFIPGLFFYDRSWRFAVFAFFTARIALENKRICP